MQWADYAPTLVLAPNPPLIFGRFATSERISNEKIRSWYFLFKLFRLHFSWPFAALLGLPIACDIVLRKKEYVFFIKWSVISAVIILALQIPVDSLFYGKLVIAPLNIVKYNVLSDHGPDLYGTEPWTYYLFNGLLNFNVAFILALLVWPLQGKQLFLIFLARGSGALESVYC